MKFKSPLPFWIAMVFLFPCAAFAQTFSLGSAAEWVDAAPGSASIELLASPAAPWTAVSNVPWLQVAANSASGVGSASIQFTYSANPGSAAQTGTLSIAGQTLTVTQAGASFAPVTALSTLPTSELTKPYGVAVDATGNLYIADAWNNTVYVWSPQTQQTAPLISTGLNHPHGVAVDSQGNVYVADTYNNAIKEWSPVSQTLTPLVIAGLNAPMGVAVDAQGNVYIADYGNNAIEEWSPGNPQLTTLVAQLGSPTGVAVDLVGNVYFADFRNNLVKQYSPSTGQATVVPITGLSFPNALTVDGQGNIYVVDGNHNAIVEWNTAAQSADTLLSSGIAGSYGVATDGQGNFYIANTSTSSILKFSAGSAGLANLSVTESCQAGTDQIAIQVLGASPVPSAVSDSAWLSVTGVSASSIAFSFPPNTTAAARIAHISIFGQQVTVTQGADTPTAIAKAGGDGQSTPVGHPFPSALQVTVTDAAGSPISGAQVSFQVVPGTSGAGGNFSTTPPMPVVTDSNGTAVSPILTANGNAGGLSVIAATGSSSATFTLASTSFNYLLGSSATLVGSAAGSASVLLIASGPWTASSNASWLQISPASAGGSGNSLIQFTFSANTGPSAQVGTLTIAGLFFTVTQLGTNYLPSPLVTTLASGLNQPQGVALDTAGNLYIADTANSLIRELPAGSGQQLAVLVSTGLNLPTGLALDQFGNIYIADSGNNAIEEWSPSVPLSTVVPGLSNPLGVALDAQGDIYFSDTGNNAINEYIRGSQQVSPITPSGVTSPTGLAVDAQGNIDFAGNNSIQQWNAATQQITALVSSGLSGPSGVAADGQGNVFFTDTGNNAIKQWNASTGQVTVIPVPGLNAPTGLTIDAQGSLYVADTNNGAVKKVVLAYLSLSIANINVPSTGGSGSVTALVFPASTPLSVSSDQSWLVVTGVAGGVVNFTCQPNILLSSRTGHITILSQTVTVAQSGDVPSAIVKSAGDRQSGPINNPFPVVLQVNISDSTGSPLAGVAVNFSVTPGSSGASAAFAAAPPMPILTDQNGNATAPVLTANGVIGAFTVTASSANLNAIFSLTNLSYTLDASSMNAASAAGAGSVLLSAGGVWNAASNTSWLQLSSGSVAGTGSTLIEFTYSANTGASIRTGVLTISGLSFTVTQAGTGYAPVSLVQTLISTGLKAPKAVALDTKNNLYIADTNNNAIKKWTAGTVSTLSIAGLSSPSAVAVDAAGNLYIADTGSNAIKKWNVATGAVTNLVTGLSAPSGVAVDAGGNVYFSDTGHNEIKEWMLSGAKVVILLSSGLKTPSGVALDGLGNLFFADTGNNQIKEWIAATGQGIVAVSSGLSGPHGVAVDGQQNIYIGSTTDNTIKEWSVANSQLLTLVNTGLKAPTGVAVDSQGIVYLADTSNNAIKEYISGYLSLGPSRNEGAQAGSDSLPVAVLPASLPVSATSNAAWLTISSASGTSIAFSVTANTATASRSAQITALGQSITVTQAGDIPASVTIVAGNSQSAIENRAFATALQVNVKDAAGKIITGAPVTFTVTPGSNGARGTFASSAAVLTNASGNATASKLTANAIAGTFTVTATAGSVNTVFHLTIAK